MAREKKFKAKLETDNFGRFYGRTQKGQLVVCDYNTTREQAYKLLNGTSDGYVELEPNPFA